MVVPIQKNFITYLKKMETLNRFVASNYVKKKKKKFLGCTTLCFCFSLIL